MRIGGWKTRTIFDRYSIIADKDVEAALGRFAGRDVEGAQERAQSPRKGR